MYFFLFHFPCRSVFRCLRAEGRGPGNGLVEVGRGAVAAELRQAPGYKRRRLVGRPLLQQLQQQPGLGLGNTQLHTDVPPAGKHFGPPAGCNASPGAFVFYFFPHLPALPRMPAQQPDAGYHPHHHHGQNQLGGAVVVHPPVGVRQAAAVRVQELQGNLALRIAGTTAQHVVAGPLRGIFRALQPGVNIKRLVFLHVHELFG